MSKEIIEFLKKNRIQYRLWTPEERAVADKIERRWWLGLDPESNSSIFAPVSSGSCRTPLGENHAKKYIYRLKPDYVPEPESMWTVYEIVERPDTVFVFGLNPNSINLLSGASGMAGFGGVMYEDCACKSMAGAGVTGEFYMIPPEPCEKCGPHRPIKVRFFRSKA